MKNVQYYMMVYNRSKEGERNMNILFFQWFAFMQKGIENALKKMNVSYDVFYYDMKDWDNDDELERKLSDYLKNSNVTYDAVFSVNFIPMVSDVCSRLVSEFNTDRYRKLKYISWVYDCPVNIRRTAALKNDCNIIYFFDRIQAESYAKQGVRGAGHMPLAVDTDIFAEAINNAFGNVVNNVASNVGNSCISDVAFVGKLYRSDYQYISKYQDEYTRGYLEGIVSTQEKIYGGYVIDDCVNDNIMKCMEIFNKNLTPSECIKRTASDIVDGGYSFVFTINFFPWLSEVCNIANIVYISLIVVAFFLICRTYKGYVT
jgi:spore maturation protein CgeB